MIAFPRDAPRLQESFSLQAEGSEGAVVELAVELTPEETVVYHWEAEEDVEFNIHSHRGESVTYHERLSQREADGVFGSRMSGEYYLMWENGHSRPIAVRVELRR
ncbi:MAG: hypothetical protein ACE5JE_03805 [Thermoplasmata archaeon]